MKSLRFMLSLVLLSISTVASRSMTRKVFRHTEKLWRRVEKPLTLIRRHRDVD